jgi:hypothetical protein
MTAQAGVFSLLAPFAFAAACAYLAYGIFSARHENGAELQAIVK